MNLLEKNIFSGALKAQKSYMLMTGGFWLWHAPGSFFQTVVAQQVFKLGYAVYVDASIKKTKQYLKKGPGRPASNSGQRPDISIWYKNGNKVRAVVEIKRAYNIAHIKGDAMRIQKWLSQKGGPTSGYILVYTEAKGAGHEGTINGRFRYWEQSLSLKLVNSRVGEQDEDGNAWAIGLLRA